MNGYLVVLPILSQHIAQRCLDSLLREDSSAKFGHGNILIVDNTKEKILVYPSYPFQYYRDPQGHNLGCARAWNVGAQKVLKENLDYLVILSSTIEFGPVLQTTWVQEMEKLWGENVIEAEGLSWKLIAIHRRIFETIGLFDTNFYPAYFEALDFSYRMRQVGWEGNWKHAWVNAMAHGVGAHIGIVNCPAPPLLKYLHKKWGGPKGEEQYTRPWNDSNKKLSFFPESSIPDLAAEYQLGKYGKDWW